VIRVLYQDRPPWRRVKAPPPEARSFHTAVGGDTPTPLLAQPQLAAEFGVGEVALKLETDRLGLPSFKILGASWGTVEALRDVLPAGWSPRDGLAALAGRLPPVTLVAATDGNHGRALARVGKLLGLATHILVPESLSDTRVSKIAEDGARLTRVSGTYDDAVARSATIGERPDHVVVSDTSWPGYERIPAAVIDGYGTILAEVEEQYAADRRRPADLVIVQLGVGSFGAAVIRGLRRAAEVTPRIVGVEPTAAACVMASLAAGARVSVPGPHDSVMAGLNCGAPSLVAWPLLQAGLDAVVAIDDRQALDGVRTLAAVDLLVGECSGAAVAACRELLAGPNADAHRARLGLGPNASVLLFATEGVTDEAGFARTLGNAATPTEEIPRP
jgi:diaminopropionate ammonia-lyase